MYYTCSTNYKQKKRKSKQATGGKVPIRKSKFDLDYFGIIPYFYKQCQGFFWLILQPILGHIPQQEVVSFSLNSEKNPN